MSVRLVQGQMLTNTSSQQQHQHHQSGKKLSSPPPPLKQSHITLSQSHTLPHSMLTHLHGLNNDQVIS